VAERGTVHGDFAREILRIVNSRIAHVDQSFSSVRMNWLKIPHSKSESTVTSPSLRRVCNVFCIEHDFGFAYLTQADHMYCDVAGA
jgi:hypothetical protein